MRFLPDGPAIPDELLTARDEGRTIFFCGAGISRARAGLSDFFGLARRVIETLGLHTDSPAKRIVEEARELETRTGISGLISADRVFGVLERDFLVSDIEAAVAKALKPSPHVDLSAHGIMLDLAKGPDNRVRLVTTNFDLLFESCDPTLRCWKPPGLPDPLRYEELDGIIHLHGQVDNHYSGSVGDGFVLSSSQFGSAYLSDGWATRFVRAILDQYFVVFVGYTADDPPVQYLLEALNRRLGSRGGLYAFQSGTINDAQARWLHKGVQPIAYDEAENHKALWDTLAAWAIRAQNSEAWYDRTIVLARKGPEALLPHERGQIAHVVSTLEGTRRWAAPDEPPPAEWLCVFDSLIRFATPGRLGGLEESGPYFDPFGAYGLDSDPLPTKIDPEDYFTKREVPANVWDCFAATRLDRQDLRDGNLAAFRGRYALNVSNLLGRQWQLANWLSKVSHEPSAVWWASHQRGLHPDIQAQIRFHLERPGKTIPTEIRKAWRYLFEAWQTRNDDNSRRDWYDLKACVDLDGWTEAEVRELALIHRPFLTAEKPYWCGPRPPEASDDVRLRNLVRLDVKYPDPHIEIQVPDEYLASAVREFRKNLEAAVTLEQELGGYGLDDLVPIEPGPDLEGESPKLTYGISVLFLFYVTLFKKLVEKDANAARQEHLAWRVDEERVFARLRIWACGNERILSAMEAGQIICDLNNEVFWDRHHQRDLLLVLAKRWADFPAAARTQIEDKLLNGPAQWDKEEAAEYSERLAWASLNRIHWLKAHECQFGFDVTAETVKLSRLAPKWQRQYADSAAASTESRGGFVRTDTEYTTLLNVPLADILSKGTELRGPSDSRFVEYNPFAGLSAERPVRAFTALTNASKRNDCPEWAWTTFLNSEARKSDKPRLAALIAGRVARLPKSVLKQLRHPVSEWLLKSSTILLKEFPNQFDAVWTKLMSVLKAESESARSSRGGNQPDWATEALNAPVGKLAQALMRDPQKENFEIDKGFPHSWISRVDQLLSLKGDLRPHALVMFAFNLNWFYAIDPAWADSNLISVLDADGEDKHALWAGFFWGGAKIPNQQFYIRLKPHLLSLAQKRFISRHDPVQVLASALLYGWARVDDGTGERWVTDAEMRGVLLEADDDFRSCILWSLGAWAKHEEANWREKVPIFLADVWPRHKKAKTPRTSSGLCDLAFSDPAVFVNIVDIIVPLVTKIDNDHLTLKSKDKIVTQYPEKTLALLSAVLPEKVSAWPYDIGTTLEQIGIADPSLLTDGRLVELKRRWNAR